MEATRSERLDATTHKLNTQEVRNRLNEMEEKGIIQAWDQRHEHDQTIFYVRDKVNDLHEFRRHEVVALVSKWMEFRPSWISIKNLCKNSNLLQ